MPGVTLQGEKGNFQIFTRNENGEKVGDARGRGIDDRGERNG